MCEVDKLKAPSDMDFRAFIVFSYRITFQIKLEAKEIRILRVRHTSREPLGYQNYKQPIFEYNSKMSVIEHFIARDWMVACERFSTP